jgi:integrase/recombinase XerD
MEQRGLAASTIDRRPSTVCGFYRFAHIDGRIASNPNGLRVSEACATNVEDLGFERGHRTLKIVGKGNKPATIPLVPRTARTMRSLGKRGGLGHVHPHMLRAAFIMAALDAGVPLRDVQTAARQADPRTTKIYDRRRQDFDRHAAYVVVAFVAGG